MGKAGGNKPSDAMKEWRRMEFRVIDICFSPSYVLTSIHYSPPPVNTFPPPSSLTFSWLFAVPVCGLCERSLGSHVSLQLTPFKALSGDKQG